MSVRSAEEIGVVSSDSPTVVPRDHVHADQGERAADGEHEPEAGGAVGRVVHAEQQDAAEHHGERPDRSERPVRRAVRLEREQRDAEDQQSDAGPRERHDGESEQGEEQRYGAEQAREDDARMRQLEGDPEDAAQEQEGDQVGVEQHVEQAQLERELVTFDRGACDGQREVLAHGGPARRSARAARAGRPRRRR